MSTNSVQGKAFKVNELDYYKCPKDVAISCGNAVTQGTEWFIPTIVGGILKGYSRRKSSTKPTPDSVKTVRVKDFENGSVYWLLIADNATEAAYNDKCAACCDAVTPMAAVTVPEPLIEESACIVVPSPETGTYTYTAIAAALGAGEKYNASGSKNGVRFTPSLSAAGYTSLAALKSAMNTAWSAFGTFDVVGQEVTFTSSDGVSGSLHVTNEIPEGAVLTLGAITPGSSYTNNGTYNGVSLTGGTGTGAKANITVAGNAVTAVVLTDGGEGYTAADQLSAAAADIGTTGTGFQVLVATVQA